MCKEHCVAEIEAVTQIQVQTITNPTAQGHTQKWGCVAQPSMLMTRDRGGTEFESDMRHTYPLPLREQR